MLTGTTLFTTLVMASALVGATTTTTTHSTNGVEYNCPNIETIEVAYAESCPPHSKTGLYDNTGATSGTYYEHAPNNYQVTNGDYQLSCVYRIPGMEGDGINCQYYSGSGKPLKAFSGQDPECPDVDQNSPQPSGGSQPPPMNGRSFGKRYDQSPQFNCPWNSDDNAKYVYSVLINSGERSQPNTAISYQCVVATSPGHTETCSYKSDGVLQPYTNGFTPQNCPTQLCTAHKSARRSLKRGVYVEDNPIHSRQVSTAASREAGKKRMPKPSSA